MLLSNRILFVFNIYESARVPYLSLSLSFSFLLFINKRSIPARSGDVKGMPNIILRETCSGRMLFHLNIPFHNSSSPVVKLLTRRPAGSYMAPQETDADLALAITLITLIFCCQYQLIWPQAFDGFVLGWKKGESKGRNK